MRPFDAAVAEPEGLGCSVGLGIRDLGLGELGQEMDRVERERI